MLGGFSDMSWENTRRVDMGDGWVFSEVTLMGTNDGEFLGVSATGLPMEVRSGLIEHYDEDGLADYVHLHFDTLSVPGQGMPEGPAEDFSNVFFTELTAGLNNAPYEKGKPSLLIAHTVKGKGVSFMENRAAWHHKVPTSEELDLAIAELDLALKKMDLKMENK